jgi:hypothetical protein
MAGSAVSPLTRPAVAALVLEAIEALDDGPWYMGDQQERWAAEIAEFISSRGWVLVDVATVYP